MQESLELEYFVQPALVQSFDLTCCICLQVMRKPVMILGRGGSACQHRFCQDCLDDWRKRQQSCPVCRVEIGQCILDGRTQNQIGDLEVKCKHFKDGCSATGKLGVNFEFYTLHNQSCGLSRIRCACSEFVIAKDLSSHLASHPNHTNKPCPFNVLGCSFQGNPFDIDGHLRSFENDHLDICLKVLIQRDSDDFKYSSESIQDLVTMMEKLKLEKPKVMIKLENEQMWRRELKVGSELLAQDRGRCGERWFTAKVVKAAQDQVLITYTEWSSIYDTWFDRMSRELDQVGKHIPTHKGGYRSSRV
jgi:hypothetical protein